MIALRGAFLDSGRGLVRQHLVVVMEIGEDFGTRVKSIDLELTRLVKLVEDQLAEVAIVQSHEALFVVFEAQAEDPLERDFVYLHLHVVEHLRLRGSLAGA